MQLEGCAAAVLSIPCATRLNRQTRGAVWADWCQPPERRLSKAGRLKLGPEGGELERDGTSLGVLLVNPGRLLLNQHPGSLERPVTPPSLTVNYLTRRKRGLSLSLCRVVQRESASVSELVTKSWPRFTCRAAESAENAPLSENSAWLLSVAIGPSQHAAGSGGLHIKF